MEEDKELVLRDLCGRLLYKVKVKVLIEKVVYNAVVHGVYADETVFVEQSSELNKVHHIDVVHVSEVKPYLRPMSSMTDEEVSDLQKINSQFCFDTFDNFAYVGAADDGFCSVEEMSNILNYLNSKHFDYRGLIERGLALEAPKGMYKI